MENTTFDIVTGFTSKTQLHRFLNKVLEKPLTIKELEARFKEMKEDENFTSLSEIFVLPFKEFAWIDKTKLSELIEGTPFQFHQIPVKQFKYKESYKTDDFVKSFKEYKFLQRAEKMKEEIIKEAKKEKEISRKKQRINSIFDFLGMFLFVYIFSMILTALESIILLTQNKSVIAEVFIGSLLSSIIAFIIYKMIRKYYDNLERN